MARRGSSHRAPKPSTTLQAETSQRTVDAIAEFLRQVPDGAAASSPTDANAILALAALKLRQHDREAAKLFARVVEQHDVREAWLGLAIALHFQGDAMPAGQALARLLANHTIRHLPPVVASIARMTQVPGWCALDSAGTLTVQIVKWQRDRLPPVASLDGRPLRLRAERGQGCYKARLPPGWRQRQELLVQLEHVDLLGSPVNVSKIAQVEGFVDTSNGDLHGWIWCPNDIDHEPALSILPRSGGSGIRIVATSFENIVATTPLARPRGFRIPAEQLLPLRGPLSVRGSDGRHLTGSPLDPSAERRSAEAASRLIAERFPATGKSCARVLPQPELIPVPAHAVGQAVSGGGKRRPVDVVVPVYGELELVLACLRSVMTELPPWARVLVIDDASPDHRIGVELAKLAARGRILLHTQTENRGFPATANVGMRQDATRDVVLLNSDTLVAPGWLVSLREAAYSARDIGTVTPLSNHASILSYPSLEQPNDIPDLEQTLALDALAQRVNAGLLVDIPTAVGFCMYIKRDCLNATGLLREDLFAQGYGEENDLCMRARHLGWRHVAAANVFVAHVGGRSFGSAKRYLINRNMHKVNQLHPGYDVLIQEFLRIDPLAEARRRLDLALWESFRTAAPSVLLITHGRRGGVQRHIADRAAALRANGLRPIVLWPVAGRSGEGRDCVLGNGPGGGTPNLRFAIPAELDRLAEVLRADHPVRGEVHHMIGHDHRLLGLFARLRIPYEVVIHDYSWLCPRINLVGSDRRYCGEPDVAACEACVEDVGPLNEEDTTPTVLRHRSGAELAGASAVVVPSADVAIRLKRHFPSIQPTVISWEDDRLLPPADPPPTSADGIRRVCVIGGIGIEKGYDVLLACARDAANRKLGLRFVVVGHSLDDARLLATGRVTISGRYEEHEAVDLIRQQRAQMAWLPSVWPETWGYTLTLAWTAGLNVLAFDIGTPAERIRRTERGWLCPLGLSAQALNERMLTIQPAKPDQAPPFFIRRPDGTPTPNRIRCTNAHIGFVRLGA